MATVNEKMTALANEIRELSGATEALSIDAMMTNISDANDEVSAQVDLISQITSSLEGKAVGGDPVLQDKTVTPAMSEQTITADNGYDGLETVTVAAIPSTYVKPTTTKAATTYTPTTSDQTIAAGTYCSGVQTIKGDANLVAGNIVSGKSIFGVIGTATTSESTPDAVAVCTSLTITGDDVTFDDIFTPKLDGTYSYKFEMKRSTVTLYDVPIDAPIILLCSASWDVAVRSYSDNVFICQQCSEMSPNVIIVKCTTTSAATLELYNND